MKAEPLFIIGATHEDFYLARQSVDSVSIHLHNTSASITGLATQEWYNFAVTYDLYTVNFYLNGTLIETADGSEHPVYFLDEENPSFCISAFSGAAQQIKIWNKGLSAEELNMEINQKDSINSEGIEHQWLLDEGTGRKVSDSAGGADFYLTKPYWVDLDGPYEIDHNSVLRVSNENKPLPLNPAFGSADLNQDGHPDLFYQGAHEWDPIVKTPLLALKNNGTGNFSDASDELIDGGLYYKRFPGGKETIIADLNNDGYEDVFIGQLGGHLSSWRESESNSLLLSNGNLGRLFPSEDTIMSPPCTRANPEFIGQKPCSANGFGTIFYPDNSLPLVAIDIRASAHGSTSGDIDNDGDIDIFVGASEFDPKPVQPYFLINDGNGNFVANWQIVPNKAFWTMERFNENDQALDEGYAIWKLRDLDRDGYLELVMFGGSSQSYLAPHQPSNQFDVEQDYWDASVHDLIAWGNASGFDESYTILSKDPLFPICQVSMFTSDIDMDNDIDIIALKMYEDNNDIRGLYLHVFANNGDRTFTDVTQQSIPQDRDYAQTLLAYFSLELEEIDFNEDQCPDFYIQAWLEVYDNFVSDQPYMMWLNNCKGYFTPIERRFLGKMGLIIPLDADSDGDTDFVSQTRGIDADNDISYLDHTLLRRTGDINIDKYIDTDRDGIRDVNDIDDDNDGVNDSEDAFPKDQYQS